MTKNQRPYRMRFKVCTVCRKRYTLSWYPKHKCEAKADEEGKTSD